MATGMDLSTYLGAEVSFWAKYDIEQGFDYMYLQVSTNGTTLDSHLRPLMQKAFLGLNIHMILVVSLEIQMLKLDFVSSAMVVIS